MQEKEADRGEEKSKEKKRKPYQKPALTAEELFEATVLACGKLQTGPACAGRPKKTS